MHSRNEQWYCMNTDCPSHLHWSGLNLKNPQISEVFVEMRGCMANLERPLSFSEIAGIWGVTKQRVAEIQERAMRRLYMRRSSIYLNISTPRTINSQWAGPNGGKSRCSSRQCSLSTLMTATTS